MTRFLARQLPEKIGETVTISGWMHKKRLLGGLNFITVRDRSGLTQILIENKDETEKLRGMQIGTVMSVTGLVVEDSRAPGGVELHDVSVQVDSAVTDEPPIEVDKPISHRSEHLDTLFENRVLGLRNLQEQKIFKIRASVVHYIRDFLREREFIEVDTPKLLAEATEGGAEVFQLDYFGKTATLAQSPQFYKQIMVGVFERVFEIGHSYRAEPSATTRHLTELAMLDIEMGFVEHDEVLDLVSEMTQSILKRTYNEHAEDLRSWNAPELKLPADGKIPRFTIAEIHQMYSKANKTDTTHEKDLIPDEERWMGDYVRKQLGSDLFYATDFPIEAAKFYHKINEENRTVAWADLIFRGLELATVPMRENNYQKMIEQMKVAGLDINHEGFKYYLQAFKYGLPSHGGCGFGISRLVQKTIGLANVKEADLFPRDMNRLNP